MSHIILESLSNILFQNLRFIENHQKPETSPSFPPSSLSLSSQSTIFSLYTISFSIHSLYMMAHTESFQKFFKRWLIEQDQHLQQLVSASESYKLQINQSDANERETALTDLVKRVMHHYEHYYRIKSFWTEVDVLSMLSPSWKTTLEDALLWIGGWRPTMSFRLLYTKSKSGVELENALAEFIRGVGTGDLVDLSPRQLERVDELHKWTMREEMEITEKSAKQQETVADTPMVELSNAITEMMREERGISESAEQREVNTEIEEMEGGLEEILLRADDLRLRTLKGVIELLTPIQAVYYLIAAAELHLRLHDCGNMMDARRRRNQEEEAAQPQPPPNPVAQ